MGYQLAVDLGTSHLAAAYGRKDRITPLPLGEAGPVVPASLGWAVGAGGPVVAEEAERLAATDPRSVLRALKRRLGDPTPLPFGDERHSVESLLARLLRYALDRGERFHGAAPESLVLTHPASWGPYRRRALTEAGRLAGAPEVHLVGEAHAAAEEFHARRPVREDQFIAVYDLGGGMFDAALLRRTPVGFALVGTPEGYENIGGTDFDDAVLRYVTERVGGATLDGLDLADPAAAAAMERLRRDCVRAKEALASQPEVIIPVSLPGRRMEVPLDRPTFEALVEEPVGATVEALGKVLEGAGEGQLAAVLLVGGSTLMPLVPRAITGGLGVPPALLDTSPHGKHSVALGALLSMHAPGAPTATLLDIPARPSGGAEGSQVAGAPVSDARAADARAADPPSAAPVKVLLAGVLLVALALITVIAVRAVIAVT